MSTDSTAARESARTTDGQFGTQTRTSPGDAQPESTMATLPNGQVEWRNPDGLLHRPDGPAWVRNGGAARGGNEAWYADGVLHRLDGPAAQWRGGVENDGGEAYMVGGVRYSKDEFPAAVAGGKPSTDVVCRAARISGMSIDSTAAAARESARADDGRFGTQARTSPGDDASPDGGRVTIDGWLARHPDDADAVANWEVRETDILKAYLELPVGSADGVVMDRAVELAGHRRGPMCDRHGGRWGHDVTCAQCCDSDGVPLPMPDEINPAYWREQAAQCRRQSAESFERSDTDGFVSQWASGISARQHDLQAKIAAEGGKHRFIALYDTDGNLVPAKYVETRYGPAWGLLSDPDNPDSRFTGFVNESNAQSAAVRERNLAKKGYRLGYVWAPAKATTSGGGRGLAGAMSVGVFPRRLDGGFDKNAETAGFAEFVDELDEQE